MVLSSIVMVITGFTVRLVSGEYTNCFTGAVQKSFSQMKFSQTRYPKTEFFPNSVFF